MTFVDPGQFYDRPQDLPPPSYPTLPAGQGTSVDVHPSAGPAAPSGAPGGSGQNADPWAVAGFVATHPAYEEGRAAVRQFLTQPADDWASAGFKKDVSTADAALAGGKNALTFGAGPAISGLSEASGMKAPDMQEEVSVGEAASRAGQFVSRPIVGGIKMLQNYFSDHPDPDVRAAYDRGRATALDEEKAAQDQHPYAFFAGQLAGSLVAPGLGAGAAASAVGRVGRGMLAGGIGGGAYGAGSAISEDKSAADVGASSLKSAAIGSALGGTIGGVLGPRVKTATGNKAADTAEALGAPLPRGLASDSPAIVAATQLSRQIPFAGQRIGERAGKTVTAAGEKIGDIASTLAAGVTDRGGAGASVRPSLQGVLDANNGRMDQAYAVLRTLLDPTKKADLPRTQQVLQDILRARSAAGQRNPLAGLEDVQNLVKGRATFEGIQRARSDIGNSLDFGAANPGFNKGDLKRVYGAMTGDMRDVVAKTVKAGINPAAAAAALDKIHAGASKIIEENKTLQKLLGSKSDEGLMASLIGAASEKSGNIHLLAQLRRSMPAQDFEQISGTLLAELGHSNKMGDFSLNQFVTNWDKLSQRAKGVMFSPQHRQWIEDIVELGRHLKGGDQYRNTSNTAGAIIGFDILKTIFEGAVAVGAGVLSPMAGAASVAGFVGGYGVARFLASPATAASAAAWAKAYQALTLGRPTPARIATFNLATRNLANTLHLDPMAVMQSVTKQLSGPGQGRVEPTQNDVEPGANQ